MTTVVHEPEWPDKVLFASMLLLVGGAMGTAFAALEFGGATFKESLVFLELVPTTWALTWSAVAAVMGACGVRYQASRWVIAGSTAAILSIGIIGVLPLAGLVALGMLIKGWFEGEEMRHNHAVGAHEWPDKALASAMILVLGGLTTAVHAGLAFAGTFDAPWLGAPFLAAVAFLCFVAARATFRLQTPWLGFTGSAALVASGSFYLLGPALGVAGILLMMYAMREYEFTPNPAAETD